MTKRRPRPQRPPDLLDPTVTIAGRDYYRIDGRWLTESQTPGLFIPAAQAGVARPSDLLDHIHELETTR